MRDRALIVAEFPAKSFILNRRRGRSRGPGIVEEGFGEGKGWREGVRATGSSINSREMQASLADSPLVFSSAFERSFDGLTGPFLTWFPASCIRVFPLSRHREMEEEEEGARFGPEKNIFDTRVRKARLHTPKYIYSHVLPPFVSIFRAWCIYLYIIRVIFLSYERRGEKEEVSFDDQSN